MAPAEHGLALMRVIDGVYRSAAQDCEVRLQAADCPMGL
jgi:hypothetical protein